MENYFSTAGKSFSFTRDCVSVCVSKESTQFVHWYEWINGWSDSRRTTNGASVLCRDNCRVLLVWRVKIWILFDYAFSISLFSFDVVTDENSLTLRKHYVHNYVLVHCAKSTFYIVRILQMLCLHCFRQKNDFDGSKQCSKIISTID